MRKRNIPAEPEPEVEIGDDDDDDDGEDNGRHLRWRNERVATIVRRFPGIAAY